MRKLQRPVKPMGTSAFAQFCISVWDLLWGGKFQFKNTNTVQWNYSESDGYELQVKFPPQIQPPSPVTPFFPFKIYIPTNVSNFIGKTAPMAVAFATGAKLVNCLITNAQTPTNLTANPPTVSVADTWRFIAIRGGYVEYRPIYLQVDTLDNLAMQVDVANTDGLWTPYFDAVHLVDESSTETLNPPIVIGVDQNSNDQVSAIFWIEITADTNVTIPKAIVCGYAISAEAVNGLIFDPLNQNSIPIGFVTTSTNPGAGTVGTLFPQQYIFDHARNRYPSGNGNFGGGTNGTMENFRGTLMSNGSGNPAGVVQNPTDLVNQLFYPGDMVVLLNYGSIDGTPAQVWSKWMFIGPTPGYMEGDWPNWDGDGFVTPLDEDSNWIQIFGPVADGPDVWQSIITLEGP